MKDINEYRIIAGLMDKTGCKLFQAFNYIETICNYWCEIYLNGKDYDYIKYMKKNAGITRKMLKKFDKATSEMTEEDPYPLEKEFALISTMLADMDDTGFEKCSPVIYKEAEEYFNELCENILKECVDLNSDAFHDLIVDGKIKKEEENKAIYRYMTMKGYHCNEYC